MHEHILDEEQKSALDLLSEYDFIAGFYLAGGTALALEYGHRQSVDFDFFKEEEFDVDQLLFQVRQKAAFEFDLKQENTLLGKINDISCSFFRYPYPLLFQLHPFKKRIALASSADIAAMKISAISTRGTKRDFVDLYFVCKKEYSLKETLGFYQKKFQMIDQDMYHATKA